MNVKPTLAIIFASLIASAIAVGCAENQVKVNNGKTTQTKSRQKLLAAQTKEKALKSMRKIVTANLKPYIDGEQLTNQLLIMETMFNASWTSNVEVKSLNKN